MVTISVERTAAYGQWRAVVMLADGSEVEGWGLTEQQATFRAQLRATQEPCAACRRGVNAGEAQVSRIAHRAVLCAACRAGRRPSGWYDASDPER